MRVILLTHGGAELVLAELGKLKSIEVVGVFIETAATPPRFFREKIKRSIRYDGYLETAKKFFAKVLKIKTVGQVEEQIVASSRELTEETARKFGIEVFTVENYHHPDSLELMRNAKADLALFTEQTLSKKMFSASRELGQSIFIRD